jgi:outer membrane lipoprotein carrier protein
MRFIWMLLLSMLPLAAEADAVERLRGFFEASTSMRAQFHQTVSDNQGRKIQEVTGTMQLQRPGKFRWDYHQPFVQIIVGDGQNVWLYDPELEQVTVRPLDKVLGSSPAALLAGSQDIDKAFSLSDAGKQGRLEWVQAVPREKESGFDKVLLGFDGDLLQTMQMHDSFGQVTEIVFSKIERNPQLVPASFKFTPPAGVDVLRE